MRYEFIEAHEQEFVVRRMCNVLGVSKAGYYAWHEREPSTHDKRDAALAQTIADIHRKSRKTYGSPRIHRALGKQGISCGRKRVARIMRKEEIKGRQRKRFRRTTNSKHEHPIAPNVLDRRFDPREIGRPNVVWAGDITYIWTMEGWLYLAVILDLFSRYVVGWSMRHTMEAELALDALQMALDRRRPQGGVLHHTDRGVQYACGDYRKLLTKNGMTCSMSKKGDCWDNAVSESFFATLKSELIETKAWQAREQVRAAVFEYIEVWYNRERLHSSLDYNSPSEYEELHTANHHDGIVYRESGAAEVALLE
jgi:putative transposase